MALYLDTLGPLTISHRLRSLADRMQDDGRRLYRRRGIIIEPGWFLLLLLLRDKDNVSVTETAEALHLSHPTMIALIRQTEKAGLVDSEPDPADRRRRLLRLSETARSNLPEYEKVWEAFRVELDKLLSACTGDLLSALESMEKMLEYNPLDARVRWRLGNDAAKAALPRRRKRRKLSPRIRHVQTCDREGVLHIARELVCTADSYAFDPEVTDGELWEYWNPSQSGRGYAAIWKGDLVGMFVIKPNFPGPASHTANASYAVRADMHRYGIGRRMAEESFDYARKLGYTAMQFNIVVSSNEGAVHLWRELGFNIIGTVPDGFRLPDGRLVPHHIMYKSLV